MSISHGERIARKHDFNSLNWGTGYDLMDEELDQIVAALNKQRSVGVSLEGLHTTLAANLTTHEADAALHNNAGINNTECRMGASPTQEVDLVVVAQALDGGHVITATTLTADITAGMVKNGVDAAGAVTANKWYFVHAIYDAVADEEAALFSLSRTAPNIAGLAGDFTQFHCCGAVFINDGSLIDPFSHDVESGLFRLFTNDAAPDTFFRIAMAAGSSAAWNTLTVPTDGLPSGVRHALVNSWNGGSATNAIYYRPVGSSCPVSTYCEMQDPAGAAGAEWQFDRMIPLNGTLQCDLYWTVAINCYLYITGFYWNE